MTRTAQKAWIYTILFWAVVLGALFAATSTSSSKEEVVPDEERTFVEHSQTKKAVVAMDVSSKKETPKKLSTPTDPYRDWHKWCEPQQYVHPCQTDEQCDGVDHPAKRPLKCIKPWWSKDTDFKVCAPDYPSKAERVWRRERLREIVRQLYFDENKYCTGKPIGKENWKCQREYAKAEELTKYLWLVYLRETTAQPWKRHKLEVDLAANKSSWFRKAESYGWGVSKDGNKMWRIQGTEQNPHFKSRHRWQAGLGPYGQNAALWTRAWDPKAPPEILCREIEATEAYLRRARRVVSALKSGIDCDHDGTKEFHPKPTWEFVHHGTSVGKICSAKTSDKFRRRAKRAGIDADRVVSVDMLGKPIDKETQNQIAKDVYTLLEERVPSPPQ